jgi:SAM-dependent methyltransferase
MGAATGYFMRTMQQAGWDVTGVEPDEKARKLAKDHFGLSILPREDLSALPEKSFDVITLWHVLEHIHDLHGTLEIIKTLLKDSGTLVVAVPNYLSYDARYYGKRWAAWDPPRHLYHFTPKAMGVLMKHHGRSITSLRRMPLDSFYVSLLSERLRRRNKPLRGLTIGKMSWIKSLFQPEKCSSITYFMNDEF